MGVQPQFNFPHIIKFRHSSAHGSRFNRHHKQPVREMVPPEESESHKEKIHKNKIGHFHRPHRYPTAAERRDQLNEKLRSSPKTKSTRLHRHQKQPVTTIVLPEEAQQLKEKILRTHRMKSTHFSLSYMKTVVVPPVDIPKDLNNQRALSVTVAGRNVPLTRCMWNNNKRKLHLMERIPETSAALHAFPTRIR